MTRTDFRYILPTIVAFTLAAGSAVDAAPRVIEITGNDQMQYSINTITAKPGESITIRLTHVGKLPVAVMGHNVVVLKKGTDANKFATAATTARETDYIPPSMKDAVLAATKMVGGGETAEVTFTVPKEPGDYPYLCSFPGHFMVGMKGTLTVK